MDNVLLVVMLFVVNWLPFAPHSRDEAGIGLRIHRFEHVRPLLAGEQLADIDFLLTLINFTENAIRYDSFLVAKASRSLRLNVVQPNGKHAILSGDFLGRPKDPLAQQLKLESKSHTSMRLRLGQFGYRLALVPGHHTIEAEFVVNDKTLQSPALTFETLDVKEERILSESPVSLDEPWKSRAPEDRIRAVIQQVEVRKRTFLIYRRYNTPKDGAGISLAYPTVVLRELTKMVALTVGGTFGANSPLRIRFRESPLDAETELTIESLGGKRWTDEDERYRQEKLKKAKP